MNDDNTSFYFYLEMRFDKFKLIKFKKKGTGIRKPDPFWF